MTIITSIICPVCKNEFFGRKEEDKIDIECIIKKGCCLDCLREQNEDLLREKDEPNSK
ncbi:MAG TPA: hypothetical protein VK255_03250 [Patescibacteria group bacterium]|nr:hypothetical protein [Patescibacteria group bacterium]